MSLDPTVLRRLATVDDFVYVERVPNVWVPVLEKDDFLGLTHDQRVFFVMKALKLAVETDFVAQLAPASDAVN